MAIDTKNNTLSNDDSWIYKLWEWADENDIPDLEWVEDEHFEEGGYWRGLPRDKEKLLSLTELDLRKNQLTELPKEIGNLTNLTELDLSWNKLTELPKEIGNLTNLTKLDLENNPNLILTKEQKEWIKTLKKMDVK